MVDIIYETSSAVVGPLVNLWDSIVKIIPGLVAALVILIFGYLVAVAIGFIVKKGLSKLSVLKRYAEKTSLLHIMGKFDLAEFSGVIVKWYVFILFLSPAADLIKLPALSNFLQKVALWVPSLIIALVIALVGFLGAEYVEMKIKGTKGKVSALIASGAKFIIIVFVAILALEQVGVDVSVAENSFLLILAGIMFAVGLAFGLGGKDAAKDALKTLKKKL